MESTSVKVFEVRNSTYELIGGSELIFKINKNINLINQKETFLKFQLRLGGKEDSAQNALAAATPSQQIKYCLDPDIGAEALIKSITVLTLDESTTLMQVNNYNKIAKLAASYSDNTTKKNIKNLYEGRGEQLLLGPKNQLHEMANINAGVDTMETNTLKHRTIEVCLPLRHCSLLGGNDLYPNMLTGLCVKIQLEEDPYKVLQAQGQVLLRDTAPFNESNGNINRVGGYSASSAYGIEKPGGGTVDDARNVIAIRTAGGTTNAARGATPVLGSGALTGLIPTAGNNSGCVCLPFTVGQIIQPVFYNAANVIQNSAALRRTITEISFAGNYCQLTLNANVDFTNNPEDFAHVYIVQPDEKPNMTLSDVELIVGAVVPNDKERNAYMNAVKGGYVYNYYSIQNYPVNVGADSTIISNLINCKLSKAKSILSTFEDLGTPTSAVDDCLSCPITEAFQPNNYHYIIDNLKTPSRNVDLRRLNRNPTQQGAFGAIHIKELSDGFRECNKVIETLEPLKRNFVISRGLSRYNHTYNFLQQRGETRLNAEFSLNSNPTLNHNFVYHWKQMIVSPQGVEVIS